MLPESVSRKKSARLQNRSTAEAVAVQDRFFALMGMNQQFRRLFEHVPGMYFFAKDALSRLMYVSAPIWQRYGLRDEYQAVGTTDYDYFPRHIADNFVREDQYILKTGQPILNRMRLWYNAQRLLDWFISTKLPIFDDRGRAVGVMGVIQSYAQRRNETMGGSRLGRVLEYIKTHHRGPVSIPDLARVGGMSRRQLVRKFQWEFGMSPKDFLIKTRIQSASDALIRVDISIAEVASEFGFSDQSAFTRQFRKTTGMTPLDFQKKYGGRGYAKTM